MCKVSHIAFKPFFTYLTIEYLFGNFLFIFVYSSDVFFDVETGLSTYEHTLVSTDLYNGWCLFLL